MLVKVSSDSFQHQLVLFNVQNCTGKNYILHCLGHVISVASRTSHPLFSTIHHPKTMTYIVMYIFLDLLLKGPNVPLFEFDYKFCLKSIIAYFSSRNVVDSHSSLWSVYQCCINVFTAESVGSLFCELSKRKGMIRSLLSLVGGL